eukprot:4081939-Prorocentrum_lima.AAC.1
MCMCSRSDHPRRRSSRLRGREQVPVVRGQASRWDSPPKVDVAVPPWRAPGANSRSVPRTQASWLRPPGGTGGLP